MKRPVSNDLVWRWIDDYVNQSISDDDAQQLASRLKNDPEVQRLYLDYCELHGLMISEVQKKEAFTKAGQDLIAGIKNSPQSQRRSVNWLFSKFPAIWLAAAASLLLLCWVMIDRTSPDPTDSGEKAVIASSVPHESAIAKSDPLSDTGASEDVAVAQVNTLKDCTWVENKEALTLGEEISAGTVVRVESGIVQFSFDSGAEVALQGPAELAFESANSCRLISGEALADVPDAARGFVMRLPKSEVVDLGTQFSASVAEEGAVDVHVHKGEVVVWDLNQSEQEVHLLEGNSVSWSPGEANWAYGQASDDRLVLSQSSRNPTFEVLKSSIPVVQQLALWLSADGPVVTDDRSRVVTWRDIAVGPNDSTEDAWQTDPDARPTIVRNAIGGKPAIRFDGSSSYLTTEPLRSTEDQTLFFVFSSTNTDLQSRSHKDSLRAARQLINYNGPVHLHRAPRTEPSQLHVLQICDRLQPGMYWGRVYSTPLGNTRGVHMGSVAASEVVEVGEPVVLTYAFHPSNNRSGLYINGDLQGVDTAPSGVTLISQKVIGRSPAYESYFSGDIAELLIYNGVLEATDIASINKYLGSKYSIDVQGNIAPLTHYQPKQRRLSAQEEVGHLVHWRSSARDK